MTEGSLKSFKGAAEPQIGAQTLRSSERPASQFVNDEVTKAKFNPDRDSGHAVSVAG